MMADNDDSRIVSISKCQKRALSEEPTLRNSLYSIANGIHKRPRLEIQDDILASEWQPENDRGDARGDVESGDDIVSDQDDKFLDGGRLTKYQMDQVKA